MKTKKLVHDVCEGEVSRKNLVCARCGKKPAGVNITLNRKRSRRVYRGRSQRSMRFEMMLGTRGDSLFGYPRQ